MQLIQHIIVLRISILTLSISVSLYFSCFKVIFGRFFYYNDALFFNLTPTRLGPCSRCRL